MYLDEDIQGVLREISCHFKCHSYNTLRETRKISKYHFVVLKTISLNASDPLIGK